MENYNYDTLSATINGSVTIKDGQGNTTELTVTEVKKNAMDGAEWEAFSVLYTGKPEVRIPEGNYLFSHPGFGEVELLLSPKSNSEYETVVVRKRSSDTSP